MTTAPREGYIDGEPLEDVAQALDRARGAEEALRRAVTRARAAGHTWQELGDVLGTSRQAAFQRFGRPGAELARGLLPDAAERAVAVLTELVAGNWTAVRRDFDERMRAEIPEEKLAGVWATVTATFGRFERMGEPHAAPAGKLTVVNVPLHFEAGEVVGQVTFHPDGSVGGLFVLPT